MRTGPETCGVCSDSCIDSPIATIEVDGIQRSCEWFGLRPQLNADLCAWGSDAAVACPESCDLCDSTRNLERSSLRLPDRNVEP